MDVLRAEGLGRGLDQEAYSELLWEVLGACVQGTKNEQVLSSVTGSENNWKDLMAVLWSEAY